MSELKKCPFCGSTDVYETYTEEYSGIKHPAIFCNGCKAIFSIEIDSPYLYCDEDYKYRKEKTIEAWNNRAAEDVKVIRCRDCRYWLPHHGWCRRPVDTIIWTDADDYCSFGSVRV